ncbi:MAG TPA: type II toxin-antitoxin system VapC family toxin [Candidatus Obscuribacterales bacterium]
MTERRKTAPILTAFWDTSAIVPLCCFQPTSSKARQLARSYGRLVVWWVTPVETVSALQRLLRDGHVTSFELTQSLTRLDYLRTRWNEVQPSEDLRDRAQRLLRTHKLRAADALQLSAALSWCDNRPRERVFITADEMLALAAEVEGFRVLNCE